MIRYKKLNQTGFDHILLIAAFFVIFGIVGAFYFIMSHAATSFGPITGIDGKCIDDKANLARDGNKIQLYSCNGTAAQRWALTSSHTVINNDGYCFDVQGAGTTPKTLVQLYHCNGTVAQQWTANSSTHTLINPHSGLCLDDQYARTTNGNQLWVYTCNGTAAQRWIFKGVTISSPTISLAANPLSITSGSSSTLQWITTNATSCTASGDWSGAKSTSGSATTGTLSTTASYTLICSGQGGTTSKQVTVTVVPVTASHLVFDDEFNGAAGSAPDSSKWQILGGTDPSRWGMECFVNNQSHVYLDGAGHLAETATYNPDGVPCKNGSGPYESGGMTTGAATNGLFDFKYGTIEASIKVPCESGLGLWPAFWSDGPNWPAGGEIDYLEVMQNHDGKNAEQSLHGPTSGGGYWNIDNQNLTSAQWCSQYHTYGAIWSPGKIGFTIDGTVTHTDTSSNVPAGGTWPFDSNSERLLLDLQVGDSGGTVTNSTFPQSMLVDYVRVYADN